MTRRKTGKVEVMESHLRALLFWAAVGMRKSRGGSYSPDLKHILEFYSTDIGFEFEERPQWGADMGKK
jgi:hypothetical protein